MPSPTIPRSSSAPFLSSPSSTKALIHPSNRSACSTHRSKSPYWLNWSNINKLGSLIIHGRKSSDSSSRHSDLTEESLDAHNRRQEAIIFRGHKFNINVKNVNDKNAKCSPYYKGLVDSSLVINRKKLPVHPNQPSSPGRESHATTVQTSASLSSFVLKMQEWGSCFSFSFKSRDTSASPVEVINSSFSSLASLSANVVNLEKSTRKDLMPLVICEEKPLLTRDDKSESHPSSATAEIIVAKHDDYDQEKPSITVYKSESQPSLATAEILVAKQDDDCAQEKPLRERISESELPHTTENMNDDKKDATIEVPSTGKFTWAEKYRPKTLKDFICNRDKALQLQGQMKDSDCNHFIFEGQAGVGKRTMILAMLNEAYGPDRVKTREECKTFYLKGESVSSIQVRMKLSSQHVEVNLSDLKGYEKHVVVELIKETHDNISSQNLLSKYENCRVIVLKDADKISTDALLYIKWLLERYKGVTKFFFCCCDSSKLQPVMKLCSIVQLLPPSDKEVVEVLEFIATQEAITLPRSLAERIAENSRNNLRQAIRSFEASWRKSYPFTENQVILTGWEDDIANIARNMIEEQSPKQLYIIRRELQSLIEHNVCPDFIFESLVEDLRKYLEEPLQLQVNSCYNDYNKNDGLSRLDYEDQLLYSRSRHQEVGEKSNDPAKLKLQKFMKIEEFIAKFMSCYKLSTAGKKDMFVNKENDE